MLCNSTVRLYRYTSDVDVGLGLGRKCALVSCTEVDPWRGEWGGGTGGGCSSQAEVEGQVGLAHLLSVDRVKLVVHRHCENVLPQTHTTCRRDTQGDQ